MFKPTFSKILLYIFVKYLFFYIFMMFKNENYALVSFGQLESFQDIFYFLFIFLSLPIINSFVLSLPLYNVFKIKNIYYFSITVLLILAVEYILYTYLASQANLWNGIYNGIISLLFFSLFFFKSIVQISKENNIKN
jgi:hypothetical protein